MSAITEISTETLCDLKGLSDAHLERRKKYITASDIPAVAGLDYFRSAGDVFLDKIGEDTPWRGSVPAAIGICLEPALRRMTEHVLEVELTRSGAWQTRGVIGATLDDITKDRTAIVQYKTAGSGLTLEDGPPPNHLVQVHAEMLVSETQLAYLAYLLGGQGPLSFRIFRIDRDDAMCDDVAAVGERFMQEHVAKRIPPEEPASLRTLSRLVRVPKKSIEVPDELVSAYRELRRKRLDAEKAAEAIKEEEEKALARILQTDLEAEAFECSSGVLTYLEQVRKPYTAPEARYRVARFKEAK